MQTQNLIDSQKKREYYCTRVLWEFYKTRNFDLLKEIIDENCRIHTKAMDRIWKDEVIAYYLWLTYFMFEYVFYQTVELVWTRKLVELGDWIYWFPRYNWWKLTYEEWKICLLFTKFYRNWNIETSILIPKINKKWLVSEIFIDDEEKYNYKKFKRQDNRKKKRWKWIPKYDISDTLEERELFDNAMIAIINFLKESWYRIVNATPQLDAVPNINAINNKWRKICFLVRWIDSSHDKDLIYEKNFIHKTLRNWCYNFAQSVWADFYIWLCYYKSSDNEREKQWLLLHGDTIKWYKIVLLEPWDFEVE